MRVYIVFKHDQLEYKEVLRVHASLENAEEHLAMLKVNEEHYWYNMEVHYIWN